MWKRNSIGTSNIAFCIFLGLDAEENRSENAGFMYFFLSSVLLSVPDDQMNRRTLKIEEMPQFQLGIIELFWNIPSNCKFYSFYLFDFSRTYWFLEVAFGYIFCFFIWILFESSSFFWWYVYTHYVLMKVLGFFFLYQFFVLELYFLLRMMFILLWCRMTMGTVAHLTWKKYTTRVWKHGRMINLLFLSIEFWLMDCDY